jgi:hypothetical protein
MSAEWSETLPPVVQPPVQQLPPELVEVTHGDQSLTAPTASLEEQEAVAAVFRHQQREADQVAGLMGMWTGTLLMHDIIKDTLQEPAGEVEVEKKKKKDGPD